MKNIFTIQEVALKNYLPSKEAFIAFENAFVHSEAVNLYAQDYEIVTNLQQALNNSIEYSEFLVKSKSVLYNPEVVMMKYLINLVACIEYIFMQVQELGNPQIYTFHIAEILSRRVDYTTAVLQFLIPLINERSHTTKD